MDDPKNSGGVHISVGGNNPGQIGVGDNVNQSQGGASPPARATPPAGGPPADLRDRLRAALTDAFSDDDLRDLCFDMHIDYEALPGGNKAAKARELVLYCQKRGQLDELAGHVRRLRPQAL